MRRLQLKQSRLDRWLPVPTQTNKLCPIWRLCNWNGSLILSVLKEYTREFRPVMEVTSNALIEKDSKKMIHSLTKMVKKLHPTCERFFTHLWDIFMFKGFGLYPQVIPIIRHWASSCSRFRMMIWCSSCCCCWRCRRPACSSSKITNSSCCLQPICNFYGGGPRHPPFLLLPTAFLQKFFFSFLYFASRLLHRWVIFSVSDNNTKEEWEGGQKKTGTMLACLLPCL